MRTQFWRSPWFWAVALRLLMVLFPRSLQGDAADYDRIAMNIASGHGFSRCWMEPFTPTAQRPPLYPMILGFFYWLGLTRDLTPILLGLAADLLSMKLVRLWAENLKLAWARQTPWVIALCPLLITYGMYPTTENLSVTLFLGALVLMGRKQAAGAGVCWGLLSLCRSYYLLFPVVLWLWQFFFARSRLDRRALTVMVATSLIFPSVWVARNASIYGKFMFSQTGMVGWQIYPGLCIPGFDWWRPEHANAFLSVASVQRMAASHCTPDDQIAEMDKAIFDDVKICLTEKPFEAVRNFVIKEIHLFTNWGLFMPYNRVPFLATQLVNAATLFVWFCIGTVLWRRRRLSAGAEEAIRVSLLNIVYVIAVTLPFAVDARYLLGPELTLLIAAIEVARTPRELLEAGLSG